VKLTPRRAVMAPKDFWMPSNCRLTPLMVA
jgi:hypothetical protein